MLQQNRQNNNSRIDKKVPDLGLIQFDRNNLHPKALPLFGPLADVILDLRLFRADPDAGGKVAGFYFDKLGYDSLAIIDRKRTARMKMAARRRIYR